MLTDIFRKLLYIISHITSILNDGQAGKSCIIGILYQMISCYRTSISGKNIYLMRKNFLIIIQIIVTFLVLSKQNFMVMSEKEKKHSR